MVREILEQQDEIESLCKKHGVERLFLFGSATQGITLSEVRDLDFLVQFRAMPPVEYAHSYFGFAEELEALFQRPVDLVELKAIDNPYFLASVESSKVPLYELS
jgi:predicted nucleotidyltransferase